MQAFDKSNVNMAEIFAKRVHAETGCTYDGEPFDKHLNHVHRVFLNNRHLLLRHLSEETEANMILKSHLFGVPFSVSGTYGFSADEIESLMNVTECAIWLHDVMEDCRISYSELSNEFGSHVAEMVYVLTNEVGRSRAEIASRTYPKIRNQGVLAVFVKLCDRIANTEAACVVDNKSYLNMYRKEYEKFRGILRQEGELDEMWDYLNRITFDSEWTEIVNIN